MFPRAKEGKRELTFVEYVLVSLSPRNDPVSSILSSHLTDVDSGCWRGWPGRLDSQPRWSDSIAHAFGST